MEKVRNRVTKNKIIFYHTNVDKLEKKTVTIIEEK
jgi:hypothetical protein